MKRRKNKIKKKTSEEPTFYCETCGHQVGAYEEACSHCGMPFYGVRCPQCGFNGKARQFVNGCPRCGYKAPPSDSYEMLEAEALAVNTAEKADSRGSSSDSSSMWLLLFVVLLFGTLIAAVIVLLI
jgi:hypothetical protein